MDAKYLLGSAFALLMLPCTMASADDEESSIDLDQLEETSFLAEGAEPDSIFGDYADHLIAPPETRQPFWYAGAEVSVLDIHARSGGLITLSQSDTTAPGVSTAAYMDGNGLESIGFAPRMLLGRKFGPNWAIQGRYWSLSKSLTHSPDGNPNIPSTGENFSTTYEIDQFQAYLIDLEAVYSLTYDEWQLDTFLGARHASYNTESLIHTFGVFTTGNFTNLLLSNGNGFDGTGATFGFTIRRPLYFPHTYAFFSARGSAMQGHTDSYGRSAGAVASSPSAPLVGAATVRREDADAELYIGEFQLGVEWEYRLKCLPAYVFLRTSYEYQDWNIMGKPTGGAGFGGTIGELTTNSFASAGLGDIQLQGVTFATGLTW